MNNIKKIFIILLLSAITALASSCHESEKVFDDHLSATSLKGGGIAYTEFERLLGKGVIDNEFTKFANNPDNYKVVIKEDSDNFTYVFSLNPYQGRAVLDGTITLTVNKKDWKVAQTVEP